MLLYALCIYILYVYEYVTCMDYHIIEIGPRLLLDGYYVTERP